MTKDEAMKLALEALELLTDTEQAFGALDYGDNAITALKEALAQPEQEPVAWMTPDGEGCRIIRFSPPVNKVPLGWDALYTTPQKRPWVDLTDEQIADYLGDEYHTMTDSDLRFFRLGVAAAKEKNT